MALVKKDTVDVVADKVRQFQQHGELHLPANYSPENAMKSAWLILQNTMDKNKKPVLETCTKNSIANSLLDMVVQGLNPSKKQCYFIAYGNQLVCQRSYFGTMTIAKSIGAKDIYAQVVYKGDEFQYEIKRGRKHVVKHIQKIENVSDENIVAAYCVIEYGDNQEFADIMTLNQIKKAWEKSKMNPGDKKSTHSQYTEEMARKTVINRCCKAFINSSNDSNLLLQKHFERADEERTEAEVSQEINQNANSEFIDIEAGPADEPAAADNTDQEQQQETSASDWTENHAPSAQNDQQATGTEGPGF
ncbi:MAG: recombinase RecT [Firmicutes bacterium]|nr:recombinase RecT [Bacillota bacterium]